MAAHGGHGILISLSVCIFLCVQCDPWAVTLNFSLPYDTEGGAVKPT
jgi:hypothetical protein